MRTRLFLVSFALIVIGLAAAERLLVPRFERVEIERAEDLLARLARAASDALEIAGDSADTQMLARRMSATLGARITFIAVDGRVRGDGDVADDRLDAVENHGTRPEVRAALAGTLGVASRKSATIGSPFLYVALPPRGAAHGVVTRAAMPLGEVNVGIARLRRSLVLAALVGLVVAGSLSTLAGRLVARPLREMTEVARAIAERRFTGRVDASQGGDLGELGASINEMSQRLERNLAELTQERDLLGAVLEGMAEGVLVTDREEHVVRANRALATHLGITIQGGPLPLLEATRQPEIVDHVRQVRATTTPARREIVMSGPPARAFLLSSAPIAGDGVVTVLLDITEQRRLERVRRDFVANVSHELRTPVATLQAAGDTLLASAFDSEQHRDLTAMVARNAQRLGRLVSDLLALARLDAGELALTMTSVAYRDVARQVIDERADTIAHKELRLEIDVPATILAHADARALAQALANLIDNAIAYTPQGGTIGILAEATETTATISVWDTGPGIEPRHRTRIFERFYRVDPGRSRDLGGTGLGLAIVRLLVDAMQGKVGVDGRRGGGSRFWITLPLAASPRD